MMFQKGGDGLRTLIYNTRDGKGNDIVKEVVIKEHKVYQVEGDCSICGRYVTEQCKTKEIVSSNFTSWNVVGEYVCTRCADLFSIYPYSYIVDPNGIRLLNVRELRDQLVKPQEPPFLFVITTSQKKHLFYNSEWNYSSGQYAVNLENETIHTSPQRMQRLFDFVECLQTLGCSKDVLKRGIIPQSCAVKLPRTGYEVLHYLNHELNRSREMQIPLYCGQKRNITEEEAIQCCINSIQIA